MGMVRRTPSVRSQKFPPAIAASATTLSRLIAASASMMTAAAVTKSPVPTAPAARKTIVAAPPGAHVEGDDNQRPGRDEFDQRYLEKGVGEREHAEPQRDRADRAEHDRAARFLRRQP